MLYQVENPHGGDIYTGQVQLDFSANTNPYGTPEGVLKAVRDSLGGICRYPDPYCRKLVRAIARFENVPESQVLCGNGAAELIYAYCRAVRPRRALELAPTFSEYSLGLAQAGCEVTRYPLSPELFFSLGEDFLGFLRVHKPDVLFLCNPNNPTGALAAPSILRRTLEICKKMKTRLFVDECFLDLTDGGESLKDALQAYPGLFLLKAFTKSYGMAGLRLGYGLSADAALLRAMSGAVQPWNVSVPAQAAGIAALEEQEFLEKTKKLIRQERPYLQQQLQAMGMEVFPSRANFLLFRGPEDLHRRLLQRGIAIRSCSNYPGLGPGWFRIAVRLPEENRTLLAAMKELVEG